MEVGNAVIGVDIGGTKIATALFDMNGNMVHQEKCLLDGKKGAEVSRLIIDMIQTMTTYGLQRSIDIKAIGVCVPGIYNPINRTVWAPNIPGWDEYHLYDELVHELQNADIQISIESDRSCYILGEVWKGNAKNCENAIFIGVGTGIGAGILSQGNIITGKSGIAGAIGWMALNPPYNDKYIECGNFEYYASGQGISRNAIEKLKTSLHVESVLRLKSEDSITAQDVFNAYEKNDVIAKEVVEEAILYWGMAFANLISIFNPEKLILGGGVFGPASSFLDRIQSEVKKWAQPISIQEVSFEISTLGGNAGVIGAGYLALKSIKKSDENK